MAILRRRRPAFHVPARARTMPVRWPPAGTGRR